MTSTDDTSTGRIHIGAADPFEACLSTISTAVAAVAEVPAWTLGEQALLARFGLALVVRARLEELTARLLGSVISREVPRAAGASSTRAWLMTTYGTSIQDASRLVAETALQEDTGWLGGGASLEGTADGRVARTEPTRAAWADGRLTAEQAVLIAGTVTKLGDDLPTEVTSRLQADLAGYAQTLAYRELQKVCRHAFEVVDPDAADAVLAAQLEDEEERARRLCELSFRRSGAGWTSFSGRLPDAQADLWRTILDSITSPRHERTVTTAADDTMIGSGRAAAEDPEPPSYPQRLGRAWCELVEHLPVDGLPQHGATPVSLLMNMTLAQLEAGIGEAVLDTGTPMSPGQCRRLACNAAVLPIVLGGDSAVLDLGMARRLFDRHQRLALAARDRGCIWAGCDRPPAWCEAHHIVSWSRGGPTDLDNGCLLCPHHHHLVHGRDGWHIKLAPDGVPEIIPPRRVDPTQAPRRHARLVRQRC